MPFKREFKQITLPSLIEKGPGAYRKGDLCYRCRGPAGPETHILRECQADPDESWKEGSVARDCGENTEEPKVRKAVEKEFVRLLGEYRIRNNQIHHRYPAEIIAEKGNAAFQSSNTSTAPSQGPAATGKAPVVGEQGSTVPGKMKTSASASNTQKGNGKSQQNTGKPKERKLLNAASQGKLNAQVYNEPMKAVGPKIVPGGIYPNKVDALEGDNLITSNYVVIEEIPDKLYRYSLSFWRPGANDTQVAYNKRRDIKSAFKASTYNGEPDKRLQDTNYSQKLDLSQLNWATNFNELWTTTSIQNHAQDLGPFLWTPPGRKRIKDLWMTVRPQRHLDNVQESFKTKQAHELSDEIRALNAIIAHSINEGDATNAIEQVGANKFFLKAGYSSIRGSCLLLKRGYFSSIRPSKLGPLLNINTATSAFLPSLTVRDLVQKVQCGGGADYAAKLLRGSYLRIAYNRPEFEGGVKLNEEEHRVKEFVQFGRSAVQQKFVKDGALVSVFDFFGTFMQGKNPEFNSIKNDLCVNVGTPVRTKKRSDEEWDDLFRIQSQKKPVWIPARLLQILPNQSIKVVLGATEAGEMIRTACRQPMGNAALIDQEGLFKLGIKGDQTHLVRKRTDSTFAIG